MIIGSGVDVIEVARIERALRRGDRFLERVFTPGEIARGRRHRAQALRFALDFAAKEAALKALGTGWGQGVGWRDVELEGEGLSGARLRLHGPAHERAGRCAGPGYRLHCALGRSRSHAMAVVLLEGVAR